MGPRGPNIHQSSPVAGKLRSGSSLEGNLVNWLRVLAGMTRTGRSRFTALALLLFFPAVATAARTVSHAGSLDATIGIVQMTNGLACASARTAQCCMAGTGVETRSSLRAIVSIRPERNLSSGVTYACVETTA